MWCVESVQVNAESRRNQLMRDMAQLRLQDEVTRLEGSLLTDGSSTAQRTVLPPYVVPDAPTLCDHLTVVRQLANSSRFIVIIPVDGRLASSGVARNFRRGDGSGEIGRVLHERSVSPVPLSHSDHWQISHTAHTCLCSSGSIKAKFHYAIWFEAGRRQVRSRSLTIFEPVCDQLQTSFEPDSIMEFGFEPVYDQLRTS